MLLKNIFLFSLFSLALGVPAPQSPPYITPEQCTKPAVRKEWRQLTIEERKAYTSAVVCLYKLKPTRLANLVGVDTEYSTFAANHKTQTPWVHFTGLFLPWHRLFIREYERSLQELCGYTGVQPYWDYTIDSGPGKNFTKSPIFHPEHGFGGNGAYDKALNDKIPASQGKFWGGGCLKDGPFKDFHFSLSRGKTWLPDSRCLSRNLWEQYTQWTEQKFEDIILVQPNFENMTVYLEGPGSGGVSLPGGWTNTIHAGGHFIVGGMPYDVETGSDPWTSVLEPLFWLHHTNLDRIWWEWQQQSEANLWSVGLRMNPRVAQDFWGPEFKFENKPMTWDSPVDLTDDFGGPKNKVKIANLLSTVGKPAPNGEKSILCYVYSKSPKNGVTDVIDVE